VLSWVHVLEWRAAVSPDAVALTDDRGGELTYAGLAAAMEREAAGYAAAGVQPGDVVPVIARNQIGWVTAMFGLVRAGALPAAVNWRLTAPEVTALLALMRPAALVSDADCAGLAKQALAGLAGAEPALLGLGEPAALAEPALLGLGEPAALAEPALLGLGEPAAPGEPAGPAGPGAEIPARPVERLRGPEPLILLHTSGTTGRPKLVPLTHQMLVAADVFMKLEVPEATVGTRHLSALPLFHVAGLANLGYVLFTGGHLHVLGGFEPAGFVDELASRRIQLTQLVPTLIQAVTDEVSSRAQPPDLSHLIEIVYGASPIRPDLLERAVRTLGCRFRQNYASSETGPLPISSLSPDDHDPARGRLGTAGRPSLGWEVRLGDRGEIQVRGAAPLPGYWNDAAATSRAMTADGFYRTGDVGVIDGDGYLTIVDRLNDVVITGGENVYPAEVEGVLASHPQVADVAVIAVPDDRWGETVHAVVVAGPGLDPAGLIDWAHQRLAGFKCPTGVSVVAQLPRNATGKVLRSALREPFWAGRDRRVS
jgi:acyl-CoA synthetase (AMP-forming)/AMP-acid ligase II